MLPSSSDHAAVSRRFATTHWSVVVAARRNDLGARTALEILCHSYWYPLYAYVRRRGSSPEDAADLIQDFFAYFLEKDALAAADQERGRFRTFLLTALQRFTGKHRRRTAALKRGGGRRRLSLDLSAGEARYRLEPFHELTAEVVYERRWAMTLLERAFDRLQAHWAAKGQDAVFQRLRGFLTGSRGGPGYAHLAIELNMSEAAVKVAVHRLRRRYRELLREEIAHTVQSAMEVEEELDHLFDILRSEKTEIARNL
jgi:DNA-directed RNA polymerase specialized sigma24 family protein